MGNRKDEHLKYLVASDLDQAWGFFVTTIGFQDILPNTSYPPAGHPSSYWFKPEIGRVLNEFQVIYIIAGEGIFQSKNCKRCKVRAGSAIFLFPGEWHSFAPIDRSGWQVYWLGFDGKHAADIMTNSFINTQQPVLDIGFTEKVVDLYEQGIDAAHLQRSGHQQLLGGITYHLLSYLIYFRKNEMFRDKDMVQQINRARMIMTANAYTNKSAEEIAEELNLSYSWFRKLFKQYTGFSPAQYQMEIKLQKAKELLTSSNMPIKTIAYELNFESASYFVTFFKSKTGISPGIFRERLHREKDKPN
ncbi:AraC family transcriptional regulator [Sphingobacterium bambusae]|uniref:AraC family transcriptional regulator n=1 Tax=Sphingobacterium bambusae TaxID=662858 RepID=A0ABW6BII1_9SPHI|nr:AraC family transcriptional regulator [Sphingobacterium bambusae]WPL49056.1 AraC family transcriptional regulator [Sphingobacterium bambusae]